MTSSACPAPTAWRPCSSSSRPRVATRAPWPPRRGRQSGRGGRALAPAAVAAIAPGTGRAAGAHGISADVVPERFVAESLVEALAEIPVRHALVARAREARDVLPDALSARCAEVDVLAL